MANDLHHVSLLTGDIPATTAFYRDLLGLRLVKNTVNQENVHMRHIFYGDYQGTPGSVVTFFGIDHLGPRYDGANYMTEIELGMPKDAAAFWQKRLGSLTIKDPNDVTVTLVPTATTLPAAAVVPNDIPAAFQLTGLVGSTLRVKDPEASREFFKVMVNATVAEDQVTLGHSHLTIVNSNSTATHRFGRGSIDHIALAVASPEVLTTLQETAEAHGYQVEEYADRGWFQSLYVKEPNGNRIEFATLTPGFTLDEPLARLGAGLGLPPHFEGQRQAITEYFTAKGVDFDD